MTSIKTPANAASRQPMRLSLRRACSGSTLAVTMCIVLIIVSFLSISALITSQFGRYMGRQQGNTDLMAAADAGLEYIYAQWKTSNSKGTAPYITASDALNTAMLTNMNSTSLPFKAAGVVFNTVSIASADENGIAATSTSAAAGTSTASVPGYPGWSGTTYNYLATVTVTESTSNYHYGFNTDTIPTLTVHRVFQFTRVPLFQAAIFYENKLEIHPGAAMTVSGLVHSNGDLWARGFSTLQFKSNVSYVGKYNEIGDSSITHGWDGYNYGWIPGVGSYSAVPFVTWSDGLTSTNSTAKASQLNQVSPIDPFGGASTNNNGLHDMVEVPVNNTSSSVAYNNAAAVIVLNSSLPTTNSAHLKITDNQGNALSAADTTALTTAINNGTTTTMYDQREGQNVIITTLDMTKLLAATTSTGGTPTALQNTWAANNGGTIYIHDVSPATATEPAIRLVNGRTLGQNITIATDNGVYIQGDYNTGGTSASSVISNQSNSNGTATPTAPGYTRYASAVMADAVTILSNNWSDSNASASLSSRTATPTTVNTAILAGDVPSNLNGNLTASGGAHNFPRFLENWDNVNFTYWGSLVEAYRSEEFTGLWQTNNVYYWPNRMWNFDTNFINNPPPGTATAFSFRAAAGSGVDLYAYLDRDEELHIVISRGCGVVVRRDAERPPGARLHVAARIGRRGRDSD